jgi:hypothetical protein
MASGAKMLVLGIEWVTAFVILVMFNYAGGQVFSVSAYLASIIGAQSVVKYSTFWWIPNFFNALLIGVLILISYRILRAFADDVDYNTPGY